MCVNKKGINLDVKKNLSHYSIKVFLIKFDIGMEQGPRVFVCASSWHFKYPADRCIIIVHRK